MMENIFATDDYVYYSKLYPSPIMIVLDEIRLGKSYKCSYIANGVIHTDVFCGRDLERVPEAVSDAMDRGLHYQYQQLFEEIATAFNTRPSHETPIRHGEKKEHHEGYDLS